METLENASSKVQRPALGICVSRRCAIYYRYQHLQLALLAGQNAAAMTPANHTAAAKIGLGHTILPGRHGIQH